MKKRLANIYAIFCTLLLVAGFLLVFYFAWERNIWGTVACLGGLVASFVLAPTLHELGHVVFASTAKMRWVFVKFFCFKLYTVEGKRRFAFSSPFAADQTQVVPTVGGDMPRRAARYTLGGLAFSGIFLCLIFIGALLKSLLSTPDYFLWGLFPYTGYLFLLNLPPVEYGSGKTDTLVYLGIKKGGEGEKCMLAAMEIQGRLYEGKSFAEIDKALYFDLPQLSEEEPLFALLLQLRYYYYLEVSDLENGASCLNRLASIQAYLPDSEVEKIAAELVYVHSLRGDLQSAEDCGKLCRNYLSGENLTAKRILAAYSLASGKTEAIAPLKAQAEALAAKEGMLGVQKFEKTLLSRIKVE